MNAHFAAHERCEVERPETDELSTGAVPSHRLTVYATFTFTRSRVEHAGNRLLARASGMRDLAEVYLQNLDDYRASIFALEQTVSADLRQ